MRMLLAQGHILSCKLLRKSACGVYKWIVWHMGNNFGFESLDWVCDLMMILTSLIFCGLLCINLYLFNYHTLSLNYTFKFCQTNIIGNIFNSMPQTKTQMKTMFSDSRMTY